MKIIELKSDNPYTEMLYNWLDKFLFWGDDHLPFIFLKKITMSDGTIVHLPRWITRKHMDTIDKEVQELMNNLNWE